MCDDVHSLLCALFVDYGGPVDKSEYVVSDRCIGNVCGDLHV